jgi:hypothetical protein
MLGKLIKYEFKAVWKFLTMAAVFMVCLTLVGVIGIHTIFPLEVYQDSVLIHASGTENTPFFGVIASLYVMAYLAGAFLLTAGSYIYLWMRFHNSMYGHQGYLTNTLPTTPAKLIVSKLVTAVVWVSASIILLISSGMALFLAVRSASGIYIHDDSPTFFAELKKYGISIPGTLTLYVILFIAAIVFSVLMMYGSSTLGQLAKKNRVFATIGFYFAITMIINFVGTLSFVISALIFDRAINDGNAAFSNGFFVSSLEAPDDMHFGFIYRSVNWVAFSYLILIILGAALLYYLTHFVTNKRLNLE